MIGLDTNVLLRYVVEDDEEQARLATELIGKCSRQNPAFISIVVLVEFTWTLRTVYKCDRSIIATLIEFTLEAEEFLHEDYGVVALALADYEEGNADFADAVISRLSSQASCETTYTFDKKASKLPHNTLLS